MTHVFGALPDGRPVEQIRLGRAPGLSAAVLTLGATLQRIEVTDRQGGRRNVILGYADVAGYLGGRDYLGATIGRYANRIAGASFELDGVHHRLAANDRGNNLHGGPEGFDRQLWTVAEVDEFNVVLMLVSPAGDQGFPGELTTRVRFALDGDTLTTEYSATTKAPTLANFSSHVYWNLDGEGSGAIAGHELMVPADQYTPIGPAGIPVAGHDSVEGTPFDVRRPRSLAPLLNSDHPQAAPVHGADHNLVVSGSADGRLSTVAVLRSRVSGIQLTLSSDRPGLQLYTGGGFDGTQRGTSGRYYQRSAGIALEPQLFPDSPHHPEWPSAVLRPGETYRSTTRMELKTL